MRKRAYTFGRKMVWEQVARQYVESFQNFVQCEQSYG